MVERVFQQPARTARAEDRHPVRRSARRLVRVVAPGPVSGEVAEVLRGVDRDGAAKQSAAFGLCTCLHRRKASLWIHRREERPGPKREGRRGLLEKLAKPEEK